MRRRLAGDAVRCFCAGLDLGFFGTVAGEIAWHGKARRAKKSTGAEDPFMLPLQRRVTDAVGRMTLHEKVAALSSCAVPIDSLGLKGYNWWSEGAHGLEWSGVSNFALPITTAQSYNRSLWRATAAHIGREARAFMNAGNPTHHGVCGG
eukprot:gene52729-23858_t